MLVYAVLMKTSTVNIAFKEDLLKEIDKIAEKESRSRSELIREAGREKYLNYGSRVAFN